MRLLKGLITLLVLGVILAAAALWYVQPAEPLNLKAQPIGIQSQVNDMLRTRKFEAVLSEQELESLIKRALAARPQVYRDVQVTGVRSTLQDGVVLADVNLIVWGRVPVGAQLRLELAWEAPDLVVRHVSTEIRQAKVPTDWFQLKPIRIRPDDYLPELVRVRGMRFTGSEIRLQLGLR